jgi:hypothetical protein
MRTLATTLVLLLVASAVLVACTKTEPVQQPTGQQPANDASADTIEETFDEGLEDAGTAPASQDIDPNDFVY